jgi:hypothetical protein
MTRSDPIACFAVSVLIATMVTISQVAEIPNSDSILFSIISLQKLTPYYWAQNRLGNLLPFLASPIGNIELNIYLQVWLRAFAAAMTPAFLVFVLRPRMPLVLSFSAALAFVFLFMRHIAIVPYWLDGSPYALSLMICCASAFVLTSAPWPVSVRAPFSLLTALVASWVNIGIIVVTAPIFALFAVFKWSATYAVLLAIALAAFVFERIHSKFYGETAYEGFVFDPALQIDGLSSAISRSVYATPLAIVAVLLLIFLWRCRTKGSSNLLLLLLAGFATILVTSLTVWFKINEFHPRYLSLPLTLVVGALGLSTAQLIYDASSRMRPLVVAASILLAIGACVWSVQPRFPRKLIDPSTEALADVAIRSNIHLIVGDYWRVWPAVFEIISRRNSDDTYGLGPRGHIMLTELRGKLAADPRFICIDDPDNCRNLLTYFTGSAVYHGKSMGEAMVPVEVSYDPYYILYELR